MPASLLCGPLAHNEHNTPQLIETQPYRVHQHLQPNSHEKHCFLAQTRTVEVNRTQQSDGLMGDMNCGSALGERVVNKCQHLLMGMKLWGQDWKEEFSVKQELKQCQ